jgi:hypothetical protein
MRGLANSLPVAAAVLGVLAAFILTTPDHVLAASPSPTSVDENEHGASGVDVDRPTSQEKSLDLAGWNAQALAVATKTTERYGQPDLRAPDRLVWTHRGPWKRIVVVRDAPAGRFSPEHPAYLEQTVAYDVPADKLTAVASFEPSLLADAGREELTARSDSEQTNFLALNIADELVRGARGVDDAKSFFSRTSALSVSGKTSDYTQGLKFQPKDQTSP